MIQKKTMTAIAVAGIAVAATSTVYFYGSDSTEHDKHLIESIEGANVRPGLYCSDVRDLMDAKPGSFVVPGRANSYKCKYPLVENGPIPIVGASNSREYVPGERVASWVFISNGYAYGPAIDYFVSGDHPLKRINLGDAMVWTANLGLEMNAARKVVGQAPMTVYEFKQALDDSSEVDHIKDGKFYGQEINSAEAVRLSTAATSTPISVKWLSGILSLILEGE